MGANKELYGQMCDNDEQRPPQQIERKKALTLSQFEVTKKATKGQMQNVLNNFRMAFDQREEIEKLILKL